MSSNIKPKQTKSRITVSSALLVVLSPWIAVNVVGVVQTDSQYVEGAGENF